jgi:UDP:flavonoid glycosyltransferase YjiC (YdhE family)
MVRGDVAVIERVQPDAVVVDLRLPASYAAELAEVPDVMIVHYLRMLPYSREPDRAARRLRQLRRPLRLGAAVKRWTSADMGGVRRLGEVVGGARMSLGLSPLDFPLRGQLVACTTTPVLDPAELPDNWRYVGPISWSFGGSEPGPRSGRPLVYLTESTADRTGFLAQAFRELRDEPIDLAAAAGGHVDIDELRALAPNATVERLLPTRPWVEAADVAIFEGGHYTGCEAQGAGTPAIVVPWRFDQWIWADRVERFGSGIALRPPRAPGAIRRAVRRILREPRYRTAAESLGAHLREWDGAAGTATLVEDVLRR